MSAGIPENSWNRPSADSTSSREPTTRRGRASGRASLRISTMPKANNASGTATARAPTALRTARSITRPTGPPARHQTPAAVIIANATSPSARPSLRCAGSISRVRPTARTAPPTPLATRFHALLIAPPPPERPERRGAAFFPRAADALAPPLPLAEAFADDRAAGFPPVRAD
nr:hypothetical protein GCM10020241_18370 [Streptoalloteichus tenebrarius]